MEKVPGRNHPVTLLVREPCPGLKRVCLFFQLGLGGSLVALWHGGSRWNALAIPSQSF